LRVHQIFRLWCEFDDQQLNRVSFDGLIDDLEIFPLEEQNGRDDQSPTLVGERDLTTKARRLEPSPLPRAHAPELPLILPILRRPTTEEFLKFLSEWNSQGTNRGIGSDPAVQCDIVNQRLAVRGISTGTIPRRNEARVFDA
jgi:hypothetical protein